MQYLVLKMKIKSAMTKYFFAFLSILYERVWHMLRCILFFSTNLFTKSVIQNQKWILRFFFKNQNANIVNNKLSIRKSKWSVRVYMHFLGISRWLIVLFYRVLHLINIFFFFCIYLGLISALQTIVGIKGL